MARHKKLRWGSEYDDLRNHITNSVNKMTRGRYRQSDLFEDAILSGFVEALSYKMAGCEYAACMKAGSRVACVFLAKETRIRRRSTSIQSPVNGEKLFEDYIMFSTLPEQETHADASLVAGIINDSKIAEIIAYGAREEGGIKRLIAEKRCRETLCLSPSGRKIRG